MSLFVFLSFSLFECSVDALLLFLCDSTTKFAARKQWLRSVVPAMAA